MCVSQWTRKAKIVNLEQFLMQVHVLHMNKTSGDFVQYI